MNKKAVIIFGAVLLLLSIVFTIIQNANAPKGELNQEAYDQLEQSIDIWMPGVLSENFENQVKSYCRSERTVDVVQSNFKVVDKAMGHNRAVTLKGILDSRGICL